MATRKQKPKPFVPGINLKFATRDLGEFERAYLAAMLWEATAYDMPGLDPEHDRSFADCGFREENIHPALLEGLMVRCRIFQRDAAYLFTREYIGFRTINESVYAGHDFWLTHQETGCGFLDGDWAEGIAEQLYRIAMTFGRYEMLFVDAQGFIQQD